MQFSECPRCGDEAFEYLESLGHCVSCLYSTDSEIRYVQVPVEVLKQKEIMSQRPVKQAQKSTGSKQGVA